MSSVPISPRRLPPAPLRDLVQRSQSTGSAAGSVTGSVTGEVTGEVRLQSEAMLQRLLALMTNSAANATRTQRLSTAQQRKLLLATHLIGDLLAPAEGETTPRQRLQSLCRHLLLVHGDPDAEIDLRVVACSGCPEALEEVVLAVAEEFVCNAICHGLHARLLGRIDVRLVTTAAGTALSVSDDGWGVFGGEMTAKGQTGGLARAAARAECHGGAIRLHRADGRTMAELVLPHHRPNGT